MSGRRGGGVPMGVSASTAPADAASENPARTARDRARSPVTHTPSARAESSASAGNTLIAYQSFCSCAAESTASTTTGHRSSSRALSRGFHSRGIAAAEVYTVSGANDSRAASQSPNAAHGSHGQYVITSSRT